MKRKRALVAVLWFISLLYSADVTGGQDDLDNYYSPSANFSCPKTCPLTGYQVSWCRCDADCTLYGDCCDSYLQSSSTDVASRLNGLFECRSIHLDGRTMPDWGESFWMVSACPSEWLDGIEDELYLDILNSCVDGSGLPPVTDPQTGLVYKNEYCAVCHQVESFIQWGYTFECNPGLAELAASQPNFTVTPDIIKRFCLVCGFRDPHSTGTAVPAARPCVHSSLVNDTCLEREDLQRMTEEPITEQLYHEMVTLCQSGPYDPVVVLEPFFDFLLPFRNQYCALCNGIRVNNATLLCVDPYVFLDPFNYCQEKALNISVEISVTAEPTSTTEPGETQSSLPVRTFIEENITDTNMTEFINGTINFDDRVFNDQPLADDQPLFLSFTVFIDPNGNTLTITVGEISVPITTSCGKGEVFDYIISECRKTACSEVGQGGSCVITGVNGDINDTNDSFPCDINTLVRLNASEYTLLDNETLEFGGDMFEIVGYLNGSPIICTNFTQNVTMVVNVTVIFYSYPVGLTALTYVGCFLSVIGCVIVLLTYSLFRELRTLPGKILMNLCASVLAVALFLLVGIPLISLSRKEGLCHTAAIFLHWLALSQFSWMTIMSCELARTMIRASKLRHTETNKVKRNIFLVYLSIGWGVPTFVTLLTVIVNYTTDYIRYGQDRFCWIGDSKSFYVVFLAPVTLSLLLNGAAFFVTSYLLVKAQRGEAKLQKEKSTSYFRIYLSVFSITGLTWVFGFVAILARDDWAWYLFIILTSTQGFTICAAFLFTFKVFSLYKKHIWSKITSRISTLKQSTQDTSLAMFYVKKGGDATTESTMSAKEKDLRNTRTGNPSKIRVCQQCQEPRSRI